MTRFAKPAAIALAIGLGSVAAAPALAQDADQQAPQTLEGETTGAGMTKGEQRLAKLLEGRVAGEPVSCINTPRNQRMQTIDKTAYVYGSGSTIYVQRTRNPENIDDSDTLVTNRFSSGQMCKLDQTTTIDPLVGMLTGVVFLDDFIPYTRVKDDTADSQS